MSIINKKIKKILFPVVKQKVTGSESVEKKSVTQDEENIETSELLLLQINNSEENEFLFI